MPLLVLTGYWEHFMMGWKKGMSGKEQRSTDLFPLLFRWNGSLYKLCYKEIIFFVISFGFSSLVYRNFLHTDYQKDVFRQWVRYCFKYIEKLPISWILGFYVTTVATRWWQQCMSLPITDRVMLAIMMYIPGDDKDSRLLRKTLCDNCNLMVALFYRSVSEPVRSKWKNLDDFVKAGLMTKKEKQLYESAEAEYPGLNLFWLPSLWFSHNMREAQKQGKVAFNDGARLIMSEFLLIRSKCETLWFYDWVSIPTVYTQLVTLTTYSFLLASIFGRQFTGKRADEISTDIFFPTWTVLENLFYLGMLKVANHMLNPNGFDDEDFDLIFLIKRQTKVAHMGTHELWDKRPSMDPITLERPNFKEKQKESLKERASRMLSSMRFFNGQRQQPMETDLPVNLVAGKVNVTFTLDESNEEIHI